MRIPSRACRVLPVAALLAALASGCGGSKGTPGPSKDKVRSTTAANVLAVLKSHNVAVKGAITCDGQAPGVIDCAGITADGMPITATLNASTSGLSCTGPMVVNVGKTQLDSLPNEKCS